MIPGILPTGIHMNKQNAVRICRVSGTTSDESMIDKTEETQVNLNT
jgi:hypothetical protein